MDRGGTLATKETRWLVVQLTSKTSPFDFRLSDILWLAFSGATVNWATSPFVNNRLSRSLLSPFYGGRWDQEEGREGC